MGAEEEEEEWVEEEPEKKKITPVELQRAIVQAGNPFEVLALTLEHAVGLDVVSAVTALDCISRSPRRHEVTRDMRLAKLLFDLNFMLHSGHRQFRPREITRLASAYAAMELKQPSMMYCIANEALKKIFEFKASELAVLLLSFAHACIQVPKMFEAAAQEFTRRVGQCTGEEIGMVAWALAILRYQSKSAMAAVSDEATRQVKECSPVALAQVLWSFDAFGHRGLVRSFSRTVCDAFPKATEWPDWGDFLAAVSACGHAPENFQQEFCRATLTPICETLVSIAEGEAVPATELCKISASVQHLGLEHSATAARSFGAQVTTGSQLPSWARLARRELREVFDEKGPIPLIPMIDPDERVSMPIVDKETYGKNMADFGVDNFGKIGGRCLLNQIGIGKSMDSWVQQCKQFIASWAEGAGKKSDDWKANTVHRRIYVLAEYHFASTLRQMSPLLEGTSFQLNGLRSDPETARRPWLCAVPLPISKWVDRTLCAEFQLMAEVADMLNKAGIEMTSPELRHSVYGVFNMYLSEPSCVSCVGAMKQFQTLFPGVDMLVDCGSVVEPLMARTEMDLQARQEADDAEAYAKALEEGEWRDGDEWEEGG